LRLPSDHGVRLPDGATLVAGSFQTFIGNFRPELFQFRRCRLKLTTFRKHRFSKDTAMVTMRFDCKALAQFLAGGCAVACILIANGQAPGNAPGMDIGSALRPVPGEVI